MTCSASRLPQCQTLPLQSCFPVTLPTPPLPPASYSNLRILYLPLLNLMWLLLALSSSLSRSIWAAAWASSLSTTSSSLTVCKLAEGTLHPVFHAHLRHQIRSVLTWNPETWSATQAVAEQTPSYALVAKSITTLSRKAGALFTTSFSHTATRNTCTWFQLH